MGKLRMTLALLISKCARLALRILRRNASYLPGHLALRICPDFLARVGKPGRIIAVTGTNGKTTVCNLLRDVLSANGVYALDNRLGSNVAAGIATSLINGVSLSGRVKYDAAVLEVDERSSARILPYLKPGLLVVTNLLRDSIMRNAHPEYIADFISKNVPPETKLVLNADDLIVSGLAPMCERVYYGITEMATDVRECVNLINDYPTCPCCNSELSFDYRRYHHIGHAKCPDCGFASPGYDYAGTLTGAGTVSVAHGGAEHEYSRPSDSIPNTYNVVTVVAALTEFGLTPDEIASGLAHASVVESRYNEDKETGTTIVMHLAKAGNASANSRALDYVCGKPGVKELIMMNNLRDHKNWSENVSWLYDCDFEFTNREDVVRIIATGPRALDYKLRLLYAGVPEDRVICVENDMDAPSRLALPPNGSVYIFYGTDTIGLARRVRDEVKAEARRRGNAN